MAWVVLANCQTLNTKTPISSIFVSHGYTAQPAFSEKFWWSLVSNPRRAHHTAIMASSAGVHERIGVYRTAHDLVPKIERKEFFVNMVAVVALYFLEVIRVITDVLCPALSSTTK